MNTNKHINPGATVVTTMAYDMETADDNNISTEIKDYLMNNLGWRNNIPEATLIRKGYKDSITYQEDMPASTLWKVQISPDEAINDFKLACEAYNVNHANDKPSLKIARGKAFAISNSQYDAVVIQ